MKPENKRVNITRVVILAVSLSAMYFIGVFSSSMLGLDFVTPGKFAKFSDVLRLVEYAYVDDVNADSLIEGSIEGMLSRLDPHSIYIPPVEQNQISERFSGEFSGIGIQFEIRDEAVLVISPIPGTPADRMGLRAGDKIIEIDGHGTLGITNEVVFQRLRGPEGSIVQIKVARNGEEPFDLSLTRGKIPIHSVETAFLLSDGITGYIMISQFTSVTAVELDEALINLFNSGMKQLILDLRGNSGGYLSQADEVADRFIEGGKTIVSTSGRLHESSEVRVSSDKNTIPFVPLVILVSQGSASASEIVAGAIQDHDRGLIIGEPTFGKGLVQSPFELEDGSVVRITTARWFTPSGRCVQRPWDENLGEYLMGIVDNGDIEAVESGIQQDHESSRFPEFNTRTGRTVYGNNGIKPDVYLDPGRLSIYGSRLMRDRILINWARDHAEKIAPIDMSFEDFRENWQPSDEMLKDFRQYAANEGLEFDRKGWEGDKVFLLTQIKAEVAQRLFNGRDFLWQILVTTDSQVQEALNRMEEAEGLARMQSEPDEG